ncbi:hypothetical protein K3495_g814 [Podosphaera aphanis]|nr:hypothetical protein K3495_g814 [Podosphaera aphanis]
MNSATAITEEKDELCVVGDTYHIRPNVTGYIEPRFVQAQFNLPTRPSQLQMTPQFARALSEAHFRDYGMPHMIIYTGSTFVWTKKFAFYDPIAQRRCTFKIGDFIRLQSVQDKDVVRVDQILVHMRERRERLLIRTTPLSLLPLRDDSVLGREYQRMTTTDRSSHD